MTEKLGKTQGSLKDFIWTYARVEANHNQNWDFREKKREKVNKDDHFQEKKN